MAIIISENVDFKMENVAKEKEKNTIMIKTLIYQEVVKHNHLHNITTDPQNT